MRQSMGSIRRWGGGERGEGIRSAVLVGREGQSRETRETALRCFRDEGTPGVNPSTGGRGVRKPGIIGSEDDILLPPNASEGGTSSELYEVVNTGDSAGRARPGVRGVGAACRRNEMK